MPITFWPSFGRDFRHSEIRLFSLLPVPIMTVYLPPFAVRYWPDTKQTKGDRVSGGNAHGTVDGVRRGRHPKLAAPGAEYCPVADLSVSDPAGPDSEGQGRRLGGGVRRLR